MFAGRVHPQFVKIAVPPRWKFVISED